MGFNELDWEEQRLDCFLSQMFSYGLLFLKLAFSVD